MVALPAGGAVLTVRGSVAIGSVLAIALLGAANAVFGVNVSSDIDLDAAWTMHVIAAGGYGVGQLHGADGVDRSDVDEDGLFDVVTGYEEGLRLSLAFNPGPAAVEAEWPRVILPDRSNLCSPEDVVIGDVDSDGAKDVVAACEQGTFRVTIFFAPAPPNTRSELLDPGNWSRVDIAASAGRRSMRAAVASVAGDGAMELVVGGKEDSGPCVTADVGYYSSPTPRDGASWTFTSARPAGWVMQMYVQDLDGDADLDIVYTDRDPIDCPTPGGKNRGITVLKSNGAWTPSWTATTYLAGQGDHKWFSLHDWDGDGGLDIIGCRSNGTTNTSYIMLNGGNFDSFPATIQVPQPGGVGQCQHAWVGDIDADDSPDIVFSYSHARNLSGMVWYKVGGAALSPTFDRGEISGILDADSDVKFDNVDCWDVDGDGDLDCVSTEQHMPDGAGPGVGAVFFSNPRLQPP